LNRLAENSEFPPGATLTVTDSTGRALVRYPNPELWVGKRFAEAPVFRYTRAHQEGLVEGQGMDGIVRLHAFAKIAGTQLDLRIGVPTDRAFAAAQAAMIRNLILLGIAAVAALIAAWAAGHWMVGRQVDKLVMATRDLATGNLAARTRMAYDTGELGQLAQAFDEMAESLQWRQAQLRESETERSRSEVRFSEMVEMSPDAILGFGEDGIIFLFNQSAEKLFHYGREEVEGLPFSRLEMDPGSPGRWMQSRVALLKRKEGDAFQAELSVSRAERDGLSFYTCILRETKAA
jgi:PAS domain-containing protein